MTDPCNLLIIRQLRLLHFYRLKPDMRLLANDSQSLEFLTRCSGRYFELLRFFRHYASCFYLVDFIGVILPDPRINVPFKRLVQYLGFSKIFNRNLWS